MRSLKLNKLAVQINALLLATAGYPLAANAAPVDIAEQPLAGVALSYAPNLALALSVEFPTGGAAYTTINGISTRGIDNPKYLNDRYRGYFNPDKCYEYIPGKHFQPVSNAGSNNTCAGTNDFSGSIMNYLTASALDVFRQVMTGGNRAYGPNKDIKAYQDGDKVNETYLRRSFKQHSSMEMRYIELKGLSQSSIKSLFPDSYISMMPDITQNKFGAASKGLPQAAKFVRKDDGKPIASDYYFYDTKLYFTSVGFGAYAMRRVTNGAAGAAPVEVTLPDMNYDAITVKVCANGHLEENCKPYGSNYKPEGLLQEYGRKGLRVAALGYLNDSTYIADAPVLRARMKYLIDKNNPGRAGGAEWNSTTGQFIINPDPQDASASGVSNSGVINYLNKFGDVSGYKTYDISAELYYAALRYLRNGGAVYHRTGLTEQQKDGFPAIYSWEDPLTDGFTGGVDSPEARCRANNIMYIGDTNTHNDLGLPNFSKVKYTEYNSAPVPGHPPTDDIQTKTYLQALLANEGLNPNSWEENRGSTNSPAGIAGLAYWARVNDIRADIKGEQNGNNFMIDVLENTSGVTAAGVSRTFKGQDNAYWLAAKYGGFELSKASDFKYNGNTYKMPVARDSWTDDKAGSSSIYGFFGNQTGSFIGIPRNYAAANNPDNMEKSLKKAFASIGTFKAPSQAAPGVTTASNELLDLEKGSKLLAATFNIGDLSGDIRVVLHKTQNHVSDTQEQWKVSTNLNAKYHDDKTNGWSQRKVYTWNGSKGINFSENSMPGTSDAKSLAEYVLGNPAEEGTKWRARTNIMGTVINSSPISILPPSSDLKLSCQFDASAKSRGIYYAVAANDGMFHIFDANTQQEIFAYIPTTALSKLEKIASPSASHMYLNDGATTYADICVGNQARSVLIGSAGRGGASIYAIDATKLSSANASNVMWEFSNADDPDLGLTIPKTSVAKNGKGDPIAILSSGYNNTSGRGSLFILNINRSGSSWAGNYQKIALGNAGVGTPFVYDEDTDGIPERVYVGDFDGNLWRIDYTKDTNIWSVAYGGSPMFKTDSHAPITGAPFAEKTRGKIYVTVGTGQYLNEDGTTDTTQNYAYGLIDDPTNTSPISSSSLVDQTIEQRAGTIEAEPPRTLWHVSKNPFEEGKHRGWRLTLMPGQAIAANSLIRFETLAEFIAVRRSTAAGTNPENICSIDGSTSIISVDLQNGGEYEEAVFDTNGDNAVNDKDTKASVYTIEGVISPSATQGQSIGSDDKTNNVTILTDQKTSDPLVVPSLNKILKKGAPTMIRVNLREIPL